MAEFKTDYSGWLKLNRKLMTSELWLSETFTRGQAWVDLLMMAQWQDDENGQAGVIVTTMTALATRWKWDRYKVMRNLKKWENEGRVKVQTVKGGRTSISLENWAKYQGMRTSFEPDRTSFRTSFCTSFSPEIRGKALYRAHLFSHVNAHGKNIYITRKGNNIYKKKEQEHDTVGASADAAPRTSEEKTIPTEYQNDFATYEEYWRWRNQ